MLIASLLGDEFKTLSSDQIDQLIDMVSDEIFKADVIREHLKARLTKEFVPNVKKAKKIK